MYSFVASALIENVAAELIHPIHEKRESSLLSPTHGEGMKLLYLSPID